MPPKRACILYGPNCSDGGVAVPGKSRCKAHGGGAWARTSQAAKGRYDTHWREVRARVLKEEPTCRECGAPSSDVDHIIAAADGGTDERSNLRGLCRDCDRKHTAAQNRARRKSKGGQQ
jgi:hypothetical protein